MEQLHKEMTRRMHRRFLLPGLVVVGAAVAGLLTTSAEAGSSPPPAQSSTVSGSTAADSASGGYQAPPSSSTSGAVRATGPIRYGVPPSSDIAAGQVLFQANCASCHGSGASGTDRAPNLVGLGAATVDFWVSTGRMPLAISSLQAVRKPPRFDRKQTLQIVSYVTSLSAQNGPGIPTVDLSKANVANGFTLFVLNCAACHTITGAGDAIADGYFAPSLHRATKTQVVEAMRTGPGNMPRFGLGTLSDKQVADISAYVTGYIQKPRNAGGLGLGGIGPVAEGFVALLIGVGGIMLVAFWIGDRA